MSRWLGSCVLLGSLVLACGPTQHVHAQPTNNKALAARIDRLVSEWKVKADEPGVAILIQQPGKLTFRKGYGLANVSNGTPNAANTLFELASTSKPFTAVAVLILHERGAMSIDDDVRKHVPELPKYSKDRPVTIRHLLHHTSGLPDYLSFDDFPAKSGEHWANEDYASQFAKQRDRHDAVFAPDDKYEYNNSNYMLLGLIIARVSKKSYGAFLKDEVFTPAGMADSFVYESPEAAAAPTVGRIRAVGYTERGQDGKWVEGWGSPPHRKETLLTVGDGGIWSSVDDMARWDTALRQGKLLKVETARLALQPSKTRNGETNQYGLGWSLYPGEGRRLNGFGHDGFWGGFRTSYYNYLAAGRTTVILSNRGDFDVDKFWYALDPVIEKHLAR